MSTIVSKLFNSPSCQTGNAHDSEAVASFFLLSKGHPLPASLVIDLHHSQQIDESTLLLCPPTRPVRMEVLPLICYSKAGSISGLVKSGSQQRLRPPLPATAEPVLRWDPPPLPSYRGQLSLLMRFFGCSRAAPADMAASCLGSVYNPLHSSVRSLGVTST